MIFFCIMKISERAGLSSNLEEMDKIDSIMEELRMDFRLWLLVS